MNSAKVLAASPTARRKVAAVAGLALLVAFLLVYIFTLEPTYAGRTASEWAEILIIPNSADANTTRQAEKAFKEMGQDGIHSLIDRFENGESERMLEFRYRFKRLLGYRGSYHSARERKLLCLEAFGRLGTNAVIATPLLLRNLDSPDREIVIRSATALQQTLGYEEQVVPKMLTLLVGQDRELVRSAIQTLRRYPGSKEKFLPLLQKMLSGPEPSVIGFACHTIKILAPADFETAAVPALTNNFLSPDPFLIIASLQALDSFQPPNQRLVDSVFPLLKHTDYQARARAIRLLGEWVNHDASSQHRRMEALTLCLAMLDDPEQEVRLSAAHALMNWGPDARKAIPKLSRLYHQAANNLGVKSEYHNVVFRLDPELAFELQNPPRNP
ncbi:MAG: HEAT repeat domain-containing protein [Verrucomicrobiota bacterium]